MPTSTAEQPAAAADAAGQQWAPMPTSSAEQPAAAAAVDAVRRRRFIIKVPLCGISISARRVAVEKLGEARSALLKAQVLNVSLTRRIDELEISARRRAGDRAAAARVPALLQQIDEIDRHNKELSHTKRYTRRRSNSARRISLRRSWMWRRRARRARRRRRHGWKPRLRAIRDRVDKMRETVKV
eukprot:1624213-Pleurochrysis_carterae.AAC.1